MIKAFQPSIRLAILPIAHPDVVQPVKAVVSISVME